MIDAMVEGDAKTVAGESPGDPGITLSMRAVRNPLDPHRDDEDFDLGWQLLCGDPEWRAWFTEHRSHLESGPATNYLVIEGRDKKSVRRQANGVLLVRVPVALLDEASDKPRFWQQIIHEVLSLRAAMDPPVEPPPSLAQILGSGPAGA
ncbi:MAG: hypothetical protein WC642_05185 [Nocardioides sp.]|jgi:hypothetical protein